MPDRETLKAYWHTCDYYRERAEDAERELEAARQVIVAMVACASQATHPDAQWAASIGRRYLRGEGRPEEVDGGKARAEYAERDVVRIAEALGATRVDDDGTVHPLEVDELVRIIHGMQRDGLCERSELRAEIERLEKELVTRREAFDEQFRQEFVETLRARNRAEKAEQKAERERDEALRMRYAALDAARWTDTLTRERDEARREAEKWRDTYLETDPDFEKNADNKHLYPFPWEREGGNDV